jgi:hypothetical protein
MIEFIAVIVGALAAGALSKAGELGGQAVTDAYDALRTLIVQKLGKSGAVQSVEDEPQSESAQAALVEALVKVGFVDDDELIQCTERLRRALNLRQQQGSGDIEVGNVVGRVNVLVSNLVASGRMRLGDLIAQTGDATLTNLTAGASQKKV